MKTKKVTLSTKELVELNISLTNKHIENIELTDEVIELIKSRIKGTHKATITNYNLRDLIDSYKCKAYSTKNEYKVRVFANYFSIENQDTFNKSIYQIVD